MNQTRCLHVLIASTLLALPVNALSKTYLCIAEAAAGVRSWGPDRIESYKMNPDRLKFLQTDESGVWLVKLIGNDNVVQKCESEYLCEDGPLGIFMREANGLFTVNAFMGGDDGSLDAVVGKGICTSVD